MATTHHKLPKKKHRHQNKTSKESWDVYADTKRILPPPPHGISSTPIPPPSIPPSPVKTFLPATATEKTILSSQSHTNVPGSDIKLKTELVARHIDYLRTHSISQLLQVVADSVSIVGHLSAKASDTLNPISEIDLAPREDLQSVSGETSKPIKSVSKAQTEDEFISREQEKRRKKHKKKE